MSMAGCGLRLPWFAWPMRSPSCRAKIVPPTRPTPIRIASRRGPIFCDSNPLTSIPKLITPPCNAFEGSITLANPRASTTHSQQPDTAITVPSAACKLPPSELQAKCQPPSSTWRRKTSVMAPLPTAHRPAVTQFLRSHLCQMSTPVKVGSRVPMPVLPTQASPVI